jgi:hypothetical protein
MYVLTNARKKGLNEAVCKGAKQFAILNCKSANRCFTLFSMAI